MQDNGEMQLVKIARPSKLALWLLTLAMLPFCWNVHAAQCNESLAETVAERYASATRYDDQGVVVPMGREVHEFETHYSRPGNLEFLFRSVERQRDGYDIVLRANDQGAFSWIESAGGEVVTKMQEKNSVSMIQSAAGVTFASSHLIPTLLLGMGSALTARKSKDAYEVKSSGQGPAECVFVFEYTNGDTATYWIDSDGLIRRYHLDQQGGIRSIEIEYRDIRIDNEH